jgi:hypothetical protein
MPPQISMLRRFRPLHEGAMIMTQSAGVPVGSVVTLWRYPVKSMLGEELRA